MHLFSLSRHRFLEDRQGRTYADVLNSTAIPFDVVLQFFNTADRQRRMIEAEVHHDRPPFAGVVRELESLEVVHDFFLLNDQMASLRFRQAVGVVVRMIMEGHGWRKTGRKGSLGVRKSAKRGVANHNTGGLSLWFIRGERYMSTSTGFASVRERHLALQSPGGRQQKRPPSRRQRRA